MERFIQDLMNGMMMVRVELWQLRQGLREGRMRPALMDAALEWDLAGVPAVARVLVDLVYQNGMVSPPTGVPVRVGAVEVRSDGSRMAPGGILRLEIRRIGHGRVVGLIAAIAAMRIGIGKCRETVGMSGTLDLIEILGEYLMVTDPVDGEGKDVWRGMDQVPWGETGNQSHRFLLQRPEM